MARFVLQPTTERWNGPPGSYWQTLPASGSPSAMMQCPTCGKTASLGNHTILPSGQVEPSVVCPSSGCGFHEHVTLADWPAKGEAPDGPRD